MTMKVVVSFWMLLVLIFANDLSTGFGGSCLVSGRVISAEVKSEQASSPNMKGNASSGDYVQLQDYGSFDPSPSSKAKVKHGPIEHGTPLRPFIPKPKPSPPPNPPPPTTSIEGAFGSRENHFREDHL